MTSRVPGEITEAPGGVIVAVTPLRKLKDRVDGVPATTVSGWAVKARMVAPPSRYWMSLGSVVTEVPAALVAVQLRVHRPWLAVLKVMAGVPCPAVMVPWVRVQV